MNSTMKKILGAKKSSSLASVLSQSKFIEKDILCDSGVPILNIGLSGQVDGGITSGVTQLVGQSRTFKCLGGNEPMYVQGLEAYMGTKDGQEEAEVHQPKIS